MSLPVAEPQFQTGNGQISNLDRCNRCGSPRSAHGIDWSCPPEMPGGARVFLVALGILLVIAGGILWDVVGRTGTLNTVAAVAMPLGLALLVMGSIMPTQQGAIPPPGARQIHRSTR